MNTWEQMMVHGVFRQALRLLLTHVDPLGSIDILNQINRGDGTKSLTDAEAINRDLALLLNRDVDIYEQSDDLNRDKPEYR